MNKSKKSFAQQNKIKKSNRIWIELEHPSNILDDNEGEHIANQANLVLKQMGVDYHTPVFWHTKKHCFCFTIDSGGSFVEAGDNGHWYNLDYLAERALVAEDNTTKAKLKLSRLAPTS